MKKLCCFLLQLLFCVTLAFAQKLINQSVLSGNGSDTPAVITTEGSGYVYVAGTTSSTNFPVVNAQVTQPPQGSIEVSVNGAPFANMGLYADWVPALAASVDGRLVLASTVRAFTAARTKASPGHSQPIRCLRLRRWPLIRLIPPTPTRKF